MLALLPSDCLLYVIRKGVQFGVVGGMGSGSSRREKGKQFLD
jgi:hypothetical protein